MDPAMHYIYTRTPPSKQKHDIPGHDYYDGWMDISMKKKLILVSRRHELASFLILRVLQLNLKTVNAYIYYT